MMTPETAVLSAILLCLIGAVVTLVVAHDREVAGWVAFVFTVATAGLVGYAVVQVLAHGAGRPDTFLALPRLGFAMRIYVDGLSAWFLLLAALIAMPAMLFSIAYMRHYPDYSVARYYPNFLLFLAAMYGLVSTTDMMWFFFVFWQMMTLPGYALIRFEHRNPANVRAANKYLLMMQIACGLTMLGAELLASSSAAAGGQALKYDFDSISANLPLLLKTRAGTVLLAFGLFLAGFGIKLGMWPFGQVWLPDAHPAAPAPVSAMLSGVMIKTGIYGLMRYFLWLVPVEAQSDYPMRGWGMLLAVMGTMTLFTGTMQALKQEQTKRLLAFHSIGQVGYILLALGACVALLPSSDWAVVALAAMGFFGALFHTLNHGLFKGLLFLNSGAMLWATGTQDLNRLGGLMKLMPCTAVTALVASFAISGVPLFNGFASKWSILVAAIGGASAAKYLAVCAVVAVVTSALTLASFIKFFGASFLSRRSALVAAKAQGCRSLEVGGAMRASQVFLAVLCVGLGLMPAVAVHMVGRALESNPQGLAHVLAKAMPFASGLGGGIACVENQALWVPLVVALVLGLMWLMASGLARLGQAPHRLAVPWLCGYVSEADPHRYVAHNFYAELKRYFHWLGGSPPPPPVQKPPSKE